MRILQHPMRKAIRVGIRKRSFRAGVQTFSEAQKVKRTAQQLRLKRAKREFEAPGHQGKSSESRYQTVRSLQSRVGHASLHNGNPSQVQQAAIQRIAGMRRRAAIALLKTRKQSPRKKLSR